MLNHYKLPDGLDTLIFDTGVLKVCEVDLDVGKDEGMAKTKMGSVVDPDTGKGRGRMGF
jgi:hypothetical protein